MRTAPTLAMTSTQRARRFRGNILVVLRVWPPNLQPGRAEKVFLPISPSRILLAPRPCPETISKYAQVL